MTNRVPKTRKNDRLLLKLILEKCLSRAYTSTQLAKGRVLELHRRLDGAGGSVQLASIKNWRHQYSFHLSYTLKFMVKEKMSVNYGVLPLEALWWADDMSAFSTGNKDAWKWTVMIMQPEFINPSMVEEATEAVRRKKKNTVSLPLVRFEPFKEGRAAQTLHFGPFSEEGPTIEKVHSFIESNANRRIGKHHEIYLSDTRRAAPEKWKTVVRQPMSG